MRSVILAGGRGSRLASYTAVLPKPLMPLGDMPILELLLRQLRRSDVTRATLAVGHLAPLLMAYFGDGEQIGLPIDYSKEEEPLGTAGPLSLLRDLTDTFVVMNGDLLTDLDFRAIVAFHRERQATATVGVYQRDVRIDLGVIATDGTDRVTGYIEKPTYRYQISMGVYVLEPAVLRFIPQGLRFDLPELMRALIDAGEKVMGYVHAGYWLDIGQPEDYERAQADFPVLRERLLGG